MKKAPVKKAPVKKAPVKKAPVKKVSVKSTAYQAEQICIEVMYMLADFKGRPSIIQYCAEKWGIGVRQVDIYIKRAHDMLAEYADENRKNSAAKAVQRMVMLKSRALKSNNLNVVLGAEKEINRILLPTKHEITGADNGPIVIEQQGLIISPEQIQEALEEFSKQNKTS